MIPRRHTGEPAQPMTRIVLIVVALLILAAAGGLLYIGAFPSDPKTQTIEKRVPNDRFQVR